MNFVKPSATQKFFADVLAKRNNRLQVKLIVVTHLVHGTDDFLEAIHEALPVAAIIPKPSSIDYCVLDRIKGKIPVLPCTRDDISQRGRDIATRLLSMVGDANVAIIDTGGYFSTILPTLREVFQSRLIGIIEDTENGHQKYEAALLTTPELEFPCPLISVARSALKEPEDFLVGQAIVFSAEALLREHGKLIVGKRSLVLGYGKIGRSIAQNLHSKAARVNVLDIDPARQVLALAHGFHTDARESLLRDAEIIFCATGNRSIRRTDIANIKRDAYLVMATSADDEIEDHPRLAANGAPHDSGNITQIRIAGNRFFLCNNGNAVNFVHGGVVGAFIKLVQAELVYAVTQVASFTDLKKINRLNDESRCFIADLWLENFYLA